MAHMALGVDIGGTKLAVARVDRDGRLTGRRTLSTPRDGTAEQLWDGWAGAARGARDYIAMVVSTGVGGGIVLDGRLLDGATGNAGHIGHVIVEPGGRVCACGAQGCLEAEASGTAIEAATGLNPQDVGEDVRRRVGMLVGLAVAAGSGVVDYGGPFFAAAQAELNARAGISFSRGGRIGPAGLGDAGLL